MAESLRAVRLFPHVPSRPHLPELRAAAAQFGHHRSQSRVLGPAPGTEAQESHGLAGHLRPPRVQLLSGGVEEYVVREVQLSGLRFVGAADHGQGQVVGGEDVHCRGQDVRGDGSDGRQEPAQFLPYGRARLGARPIAPGRGSVAALDGVPATVGKGRGGTPTRLACQVVQVCVLGRVEP